MKLLLASMIGTGSSAFVAGLITAFYIGSIIYNVKFVGILDTDMAIIAKLKDFGIPQLDTYPAEVVARLVEVYKRDPRNIDAIANIIMDYENMREQANLLRPHTPDND